MKTKVFVVISINAILSSFHLNLMEEDVVSINYDFHHELVLSNNTLTLVESGKVIKSIELTPE